MKSNAMVKGPGSEPQLSTREGEEGVLTWGRWSLTVFAKLTLYAGAIHYVMRVDVHGDQDGGEHGMFGDLETGPCATLEDAANEAKRLRLTLRSEHMEDGDEDTCTYERTIDLTPAVDAACKGVHDAIKGEAEYIREHVDGLAKDTTHEALEVELVQLRRWSADKQGMLEIYGKAIGELMPGARAAGEPIEAARSIAKQLVRKYLGLPTLAELRDRGVPFAGPPLEERADRLKLVSMKSAFGAERGTLYEAIFIRENA